MTWTRLAASLRFLGIDVGGPWVARWQPPVGDESRALWQDIAARRVWRAELVSGWLESTSSTRTAADPASQSVDRRARPSRRRRAIWAPLLVAVAAMLITSVGALAFFTSAGAGSGGGAVGPTQAVTISPGTTPPQQGLYPAGSADVALTITNPNTFAVHLHSLIVDTAQPTNGFAVDAGHSGCNVASLSFNGPQTNGGSDFVVPASGHLDLDLTNAISMSSGGSERLPGRNVHRVRQSRPMTSLLKTLWSPVAVALRLLGFGFGVSESTWKPPVGDGRYHLWTEIEKRRGERAEKPRAATRRGAGRRRLIALPVGLLAALSLAGMAFAYLSASTTSGSNGKSLAGSVGAPSSPTVPAYSSDGHVTVSWGAATLASGGAVQGYYVVRSDSTVVCGSLASPVTGPSCSDVVGTNGTYTYTVAAVYGQWTTTATSGPVLVDTVSPAPTVTAPAAGATSVSVTPTITGTAGAQPADSSHSADNGAVAVAVYLGTDTTVAPAQTFSGVAVVSGTWTVNVSTALSGGTQYTVKVTQGDAAGNSGSSMSSFTTTAVSSKLRITSTAQTFTAGAASGTITVERDDSSNNPVTTGTTTVDLTTSSAAGLFRNTADSATITSVTITAGTSSASFRYRDTTAGSPTITAADHAGVLTSGTQSETVNPSTASKLAFTVSPGATSADNALTPQPQVTVQDTYGNTVTT